MKVFEEVEVQVPASDVSRKDFRIMIEMGVIALIVLVITLLV